MEAKEKQFKPTQSQPGKHLLSVKAPTHSKGAPSPEPQVLQAGSNSALQPEPGGTELGQADYASPS